MRHTPGGHPPANRPFRWDLVRPDQLGSLLDGCEPPDYFVGRSADSVFDLVFVGLVSSGSTFENLYQVMRDWIADERAQWDVIRGKLRFLGITWREHASPNTWRWQQHAAWTEDLPRRSIRNVSLAGAVWSYLGNEQPKITPSFSRHRWSEKEINHPRRGEDTRAALAEAVALVERGRLAATRRQLARHIVAEPTSSEAWLRSLVRELGAGT